MTFWVAITHMVTILCDSVKFLGQTLLMAEQGLSFLEENTGFNRLELFWVSTCVPLSFVTFYALFDAANALMKIFEKTLERGRRVYLNVFGYTVRHLVDVKDLTTVRGALIDVDALVQKKVMELVPEFTPVLVEGAYGRGFVYETRDGIPKGVFQVWGRPPGSKDLVWLGHGGACLGKGYCTYHQLHDKEGKPNCEQYFIGTPRRDQVLPVKIGRNGYNFDGVDYGLDVCEILPGGAFATLGIKSLKPGIYQPDKGVTYFHYNVLNRKYYSEYAKDINGKVDEHGRPGHPLAIHTETTTSPGDSGMPVIQGVDELVFVHQGDVPAFKLNAAHPPIPFFMEFYQTVLKRQEDKEVKIIQKEMTPIAVESPSKPQANGQAGKEVEETRQATPVSVESPNQKGKNKYVEKSMDWVAAAQAKKDERMRGEHRDDQGFGQGKVSKGSWKPELAGYASAQDFEDVVIKKGVPWADVLNESKVEQEAFRKEYAEKYNILDTKLDRLLKYIAAEEPPSQTERAPPGVLNSSGHVGSPELRTKVAFESPAEIRVQLGLQQPKAKPPQALKKKRQVLEEAAPSAPTATSASMEKPAKSTLKSKVESLKLRLESLTEQERIALAKWLTEQNKGPNPPKEAQMSSDSSQPKGPSKSSVRRLKAREKLEKKLLKDLQNSTPPQRVEQLSETACTSTSSEPPKQE